MTGRLFGLTKWQQAARRDREERIDLTYRQQAVLRRQGLIAHSVEWYTSPVGSFSLAPGDPGASWGKGHRKRVNLGVVPSQVGNAA